jgi:DNA-directed RNA polymerase specialized sigma24 family protein
MVPGVGRDQVRDPHLAEDAIQAVFLVLARKARFIRDSELLGNWLSGVAVRTSRKASYTGGTAAIGRHQAWQPKAAAPHSRQCIRWIDQLDVSRCLTCLPRREAAKVKMRPKPSARPASRGPAKGSPSLLL